MNKRKNMQMKSQKKYLISQNRSVVPGPLCLNCEQKKKVEYLITLGNNSGFICSSCYDSNIWANKLGISTKTEKELPHYSIPRDTQEEKEDNQNLNPKLRLV